MKSQAILNYVRKNPCPRLEEVGQAVGLSVTALLQRLWGLRGKGWVTWEPKKCRTLHLTGSGLLAAQGYELLYTCDKDGVKLA